MKNEYTSEQCKQIAQIAEIMSHYWRRGDNYTRARLEGDKFEIQQRATYLLDSIGTVRTIPQTIREQMTFALADNETLVSLEDTCQKEIDDFNKETQEMFKGEKK